MFRLYFCFIFKILFCNFLFPISEKPAEMIIIFFICFFSQSKIIFGTNFAGIAITTNSIFLGYSKIVLYAFRFSTFSSDLFIGITFPLKDFSFCIIMFPTFPSVFEAPITAIDFALKNVFSSFSIYVK